MAVPKLRFPHFKNGWNYNKLNKYLIENKTRNKGKVYSKEDVLSVSGEYGVINQIVLQGRSFAGQSVELYHIVENDDVVYTKSPLKANPYGIIKRNGGNAGIVSTLYAVYHPTEYADSRFIEYYFSNDLRLNKYLKPLVNIGAKHDMKISNVKVISDFVSFPALEEQQKIADFLTTFDKRITAQQNIIADLEETKKGLLQKIFSQEIRFKDDNGQDYPEWEEKRLGDISYVMRGLTYKPTDVRDDGIRVFRSSNISEDTFIYGEDDVFVDVNAVNIPFVQNGDILITAANGSSRLVGKHSVIHGVLNDTAVHGGFMLLIRSKDSAFINSSMYSSWYKKFVYKFVAGGNGAIGNLKKSDLENVHLFVPCEKEKNKIDDFLSIFDKKITAEKQVLSDLQEMKKGLLQQMFV